jgi:hypothetical protein
LFEFTITLGTILQIGAGITGVIAAYQFVSSSGDADLVEAMEDTPTSSIREVTPGGYFEVKGKATSAHPLKAPKVLDEVIFYRYIQRAEWDETDREGNTEKCQEVLKDESEAAAFTVQDKTGEIQVNPKGARLEGKLLTRDLAERFQGGGSLVATAAMGMAPGRQTGRRNYKVFHEIFGATNGCEIYVLGSTGQGPTGEAVFQKKPSEERPFLLSARSEEELTERLHEGNTIRTMLAWAFAALFLLFLAGALFLPKETLDYEIELESGRRSRHGVQLRL